MEGHRLRVKERFLQEGLDGFAPHEVLEMLLFYAIPRRDVNPLAHELIMQFGSLSNVLEADPQDLAQVPGMTEHAAIMLSMVPKLTRAYFMSRWSPRERLDTPRKTGQYAVELCAGLTRECAYCVCLDRQNRVLANVQLSEGGLSSVELQPRKVAEVAFKTHAASIVLLHNHPGGSLRISTDDLRATDWMGRALAAVSVGFQDHIVVAGNRFVSMAGKRRDGWISETSVLEDWQFSAYPGAAETDSKGLDE